jgi:hypothetical protein
MAIHVDFACNDPDNGNPVGKFHQLQVQAGVDDMEFEGPCYQRDGVIFRMEGEMAHVGRLRIPVLAYRSWVGNWCWDRIYVSWVHALEIINYLGKLEKQGWHMSCGPEQLFEAFNERHAITPAEWKTNTELNASLTPKGQHD